MRTVCLLLLLGGAALAKPKTRNIKLPKGSVELPGEWFACTKDADCDFAVGPRECNLVIFPINKQHKKDAEKKMSPLCAGEEVGGVIGGTGPVCKANECADH